jgi:hypothetical protein
MSPWWIAALVVAMVIAFVASLRWRVTVHRVDDPLIDDLIRQKGVGADPLYHRPGVVVFIKTTTPDEPRGA